MYFLSITDSNIWPSNRKSRSRGTTSLITSLMVNWMAYNLVKKWLIHLELFCEVYKWVIHSWYTHDTLMIHLLHLMLHVGKFLVFDLFYSYIKVTNFECQNSPSAQVSSNRKKWAMTRLNRMSGVRWCYNETRTKGRILAPNVIDCVASCRPATAGCWYHNMTSVLL